jgi:hypothetical protein
MIMTSLWIPGLFIANAFLFREGVIEGGIGIVGILMRKSLPSSNTLLWWGLMFLDMI